MFDNIGGKIKALAQVVCWIGIIFSFIGGIAVMLSDVDLFFLSFVIIVVGAISSWVSSFVLYGFGQLIDNTDELVHYKNFIVDCNQMKSSTKQDNRKSTGNKSSFGEGRLNEENNKSVSMTNDLKNLVLSDFIEEIKKIDTAELELMAYEFAHIYSPEELKAIKKELSSR